jgi:hypothetical protein
VWFNFSKVKGGLSGRWEEGGEREKKERKREKERRKKAQPSPMKEENKRATNPNQ